MSGPEPLMGAVPGVASGPPLRFLPALRMAADPAALDAAPRAAGWPPTARLARVAPDDAVAILRDPADAEAVAALVTGVDRFALVEPETGLVGFELATDDATRWVAAHADWLLEPAHVPAGGLAQGLVAGVPVKILVDGDRALVLVPTAYAGELAERWEEAR